jgi:hypothetical protein
MAPAKTTSPAPRVPAPAEIRDLAEWLRAHYDYSLPAAQRLAEDAFIAVYDEYRTSGPGYCGALMSVVWNGGPSFYDVFTWEGDALRRRGREFDEHECSRCGRLYGTLCTNCWRRERSSL